MKKQLFILLFCLACTLSVYSQTQNFKYQAVVRDALGDVIENQNVSIKIDILKGSSIGTVSYSEEHSLTTNQFGLVNIEIGSGNILSGSFSAIEWGQDIYFLKTELDETGGSSYQMMGVSQLLAVPYALYAQSSADSSLWGKNGNNIYYEDGNVGIGAITPNSKLLVQSDPTAATNDDIFSVLNANGDTVFAVYQEGVRIWVDDDGGTKSNSNRGGFAVGGFSPSKAGFTNEYLRVTPDSVRVYIDDDFVGSKATGNRGGFAVGGFNPSKGTATDNYLFVQDDSTRVYVNGDEGFAVDNIEASPTEGRYMDLTPENYFIGHHSGDAITTGKYNSFFGYETGLDAEDAFRNVFLGYQAGYNNISANENNFIGYQAGYSNSTGERNNFIGYEAGYSNTIGDRNTFVGTSAGRTNIDGQYNSLFGHYSGYLASLNNNNFFAGYYSGYNADNADDCIMIGSSSGRNADNSSNSVFLGTSSGYNNNAANNIFIGYQTGYSNTSGSNNTFLGTESGYNNGSGEKNVFMGYKSGHSNIGGSANILDVVDVSSFPRRIQLLAPISDSFPIKILLLPAAGLKPACLPIKMQLLTLGPAPI